MTDSTRRTPRKAKSTEPDRADCPHCRGGAETFRYLKRQYVFDVDQARRLVADGREVLELDEDDVRHSVANSRIYPQHLPHVDTRYPGIVAHIWYQQPDGEVVHGDLLIDGHHRAARCLELGLPFSVQRLTEEESRAVLVQAPPIRERQPALV